MNKTPPSDPNDPISGLLIDAATRAEQYLESLSSRRVGPDGAALEQLDRFDEAFPEHGESAASTLALLDEAGSPNTMASPGGRYFGFVNGGTLPASLAAHTLASAWDQNSALSVMSPVASKLQQVASTWILEALSFPSEGGAFFVGSATVANLCGVVAARDHLLAEAGYDVAARGLIGAPKINVLAGSSVHSTSAKALSIAGLGRACVHSVPVDEEGRMRADLLSEVAQATGKPEAPTMVLAQAGEVNSGAFDPFDEIANWAEQRNAWVHVDGAFGLWAAASESKRHLVAGLDRANSWATDGHKWLNVPYDSGVILVRDPSTLRRSMAVSAAYLVDEGAILEPMHHTPQSSQRARGIDAWAALRSLGRTGLQELVDRTCAHARRFAEALTSAGFEVLNDVVLNQVLVRFGTDEQTARVIATLQEDGTCWCGPTVWRGQGAMRISVSSWATTNEDVERSVAAMISAAGVAGAAGGEASGAHETSARSTNADDADV